MLYEPVDILEYWMGIYNWLSFGVNWIQNGHHNEQTLENTKNGPNSANLCKKWIKIDLVVA